MGNKPKHKMPVSERAKQFMPFSALRGFNQILRTKEHLKTEKIELTEDMAAKLNLLFHQLAPKMMVCVTYFSQEEYVKISGMVAKVDTTSRILQVVNTRIPFDTILDIDILNHPTRLL